jgi:inner membrane protein
MDTITHTLTGAVIAKAIDDEKIGNWGPIAGLTAGFFPDSDFVLGLINRQFYLEYHRNFTHSLLLIPFYALFFSWLFVKISKRAHFWSYFKVCLPVLVSHVVFDLLTSYGTMIMSPFFEHRFAWDLIFVIDLIFSGIILLPLMVSLYWKDKSRWVCRGSLIGLTLYILFCWVQHQRAIDLARAFGKDLNEEVIQVASLPQPISPFRWANYLET